MYYMQTVSEPAETLKDFKKRKWIALKATQISLS